MDGELGIFEALFVASITVNVCAWMQFGVYAVMDRLVARETQTRLTRFRLAHKHNAAFMRNFYVDAVIFTCLPVATFVLAFTTRALDSPFVANYPAELRVLFSVLSGVLIFLLFRCCLVAKNDPIKYMNIIIYIVSLATAVTVLLTGEDVTIGLVLAISMGDIFLLNVSKFVQVTRIQSVRCQRIVMLLSIYACIVFRAFLPLACISISLINGKPFDMSYQSIFIFFVGILFFGAMNTWQVNSGISQLCRRKTETVIEVPYRTFGDDSVPKPEDIAVASSSIEMPPSYNEVCSSNSYLPVSLPPSADTHNETAPSVVITMNNELLVIDAQMLAQDATQIEAAPKPETTSDTAALI
ncbi:uncharacterized protein [Asterias amurensis]|uniref:uncharacterized protein n=1 Tax=Asterias amurensis TaxID=7602 RepID=UPI003AB76490